jgi:hypothetical protein
VESAAQPICPSAGYSSSVPKEFAALAGLAAVLASATAHATPSARLVYSRARGAGSCPDEQALRGAVAARVGYDPFFSWAKQTIVAAMASGPSGGFVATVRLVDEEGVDHGSRSVSTQGECRELVEVAALAIAIAIDPHSLMPAPAAPPVAVAEAPVIAPTQAPSPSAPSPEAFAAPAPGTSTTAAVVYEGNAGAVVSAGVAPAPVFGGALGVAARWARASLGLEGRIDVPVSVAARGGGTVSSELIVVSLLPCVHLGRAFLCALGQIGHQSESGAGAPSAEQKSTIWWAAGGRLGVEVPLQSVLALRVRSDVVADLRPPVLLLNNLLAWGAPVVSTSLGADVVMHFR